MKQLRVAVLGQGRSGFGIHVRWLRDDKEHFKIVAVADLMPERRKEAEEELCVKTYIDYKELLNDKNLDLDLIVNALPTPLHTEGTIAAFEAGYDVVSEKPVAVSVKDFDLMVAAADKAGKKLLPFQNSRFQPAFQRLLSVVNSGCLGRIIHARINYSNFARRWDWQTKREMSGGNLLNTGPHPMDQAIVLFGDETPNVFARMVSDNPFGDAENFASVTLWGENKPTIEVVVSSFMAYPQGSVFNISGTFGGLTGDFNKLEWKYFDPDMAPEQSLPENIWTENRAYCGETLEWNEESWSITPDIDNFTIISRGFYNNAYDILVNDASRVITLEQVRRQIAAIEEAHRQNPNLL